MRDETHKTHDDNAHMMMLELGPSNNNDLMRANLQYQAVAQVVAVRHNGGAHEVVAR